MTRLVSIAAALCALLLAGSARADERFSDGEKSFQRARELIAAESNDTRSSDELWRDATAGLVGGRHWDSLLSPSQLAALKTDLAGELVGIGVEIHVVDGMVTITNVLPASGAAEAGLRAGDKILKIDGASFAQKGERDVVAAVRGKAGSTVKLSLLRDADVLTKTVKRAALMLQPVTAIALGDGVALVQIRAFNERTPELLKRALGQLASPSLRGLVIDLRHNQGGLFDGMLKCAGLLLPRGALVVTAVYRGGKEEAKRTGDEPMLARLRAAVLVNGATASGAEMLAGALQAGVGARVIGARTFGKWNAQRVVDLPNGWALKLTSAVFKTPDGRLLDGKGLDPDLPVDMEPVAVLRAQALADPKARLAADAALRAAVDWLKLAR